MDHINFEYTSICLRRTATLKQFVFLEKCFFVLKIVFLFEGIKIEG